MFFPCFSSFFWLIRTLQLVWTNKIHFYWIVSRVGICNMYILYFGGSLGKPALHGLWEFLILHDFCWAFLEIFRNGGAWFFSIIPFHGFGKCGKIWWGYLLNTRRFFLLNSKLFPRIFSNFNFFTNFPDNFLKIFKILKDFPNFLIYFNFWRI